MRRWWHNKSLPPVFMGSASDAMYRDLKHLVVVPGNNIVCIVGTQIYFRPLVGPTRLPASPPRAITTYCVPGGSTTLL